MYCIPARSSRRSGEKLLHPREYEDGARHRAYFFGPFRLFCGDRIVGVEEFRRHKARMLLQWLLLNPGKPLAVDEFVDMFWRDSNPEKAVGNFHVTMHYLRRILEPDLDPRQESAFIRRGPNSFYFFHAGESWWTDIDDVEILLKRGCACDVQGHTQRACFYYSRVASYCIQGFLTYGSTGEWLTPYRARYRQIYAQVLMRLMQLHMRRGEPEELLEYAYQMLRIDCHNEMAMKVIVDAYVKEGSFERAKRRLDHFFYSLQNELGVGPGKELYALREQIHSALNV
jgi:DNA-binding SARP family transcriptional activator